MDRRILAAAVLATLVACKDQGPEPVSVSRPIHGYIEFSWAGGFEPLRVRMPADSLEAGVETTIHIYTYRQGCFGEGPLEVFSQDGSAAHVLPWDVANVSYPPQPCPAGLRQFTHELLVTAAPGAPYRLRVTGGSNLEDTLITREVLLPVR